MSMTIPEERAAEQGTAAWVPANTFGHRLVLIRKHLGLSQDEVAKLCNLKPSTWFSWENGTQPRALDQVVRAIHEATGCDRDWLMWGQTPNSCDYAGNIRVTSHPTLFDGFLTVPPAA